jgi:hypothetical protein
MVSKLKIPAKWTKGAAVQIIIILSWTHNKFCNRLQWFLQQILWSKAGLLQQILEQTATSFCDWKLTATNVVMELTLLSTLLQWVCFASCRNLRSGEWYDRALLEQVDRWSSLLDWINNKSDGNWLS